MQSLNGTNICRNVEIWIFRKFVYIFILPEHHETTRTNRNKRVKKWGIRVRWVECVWGRRKWEWNGWKKCQKWSGNGLHIQNFKMSSRTAMQRWWTIEAMISIAIYLLWTYFRSILSISFLFQSHWLPKSLIMIFHSHLLIKWTLSNM